MQWVDRDRRSFSGWFSWCNVWILQASAYKMLFFYSRLYPVKPKKNVLRTFNGIQSSYDIWSCIVLYFDRIKPPPLNYFSTSHQSEFRHACGLPLRMILMFIQHFLLPFLSIWRSWSSCFWSQDRTNHDRPCDNRWQKKQGFSIFIIKFTLI